MIVFGRKDRSRVVAAILALALLGATPAAAHADDPAKPTDPKPADPKPPEAKPGDPAKKPEPPPPPPPPTPEEVKEFTKQYEATLKKMTVEDAIAGVAKLRGWYVNPGTPEDSKKVILGTMGLVLEQKAKESLLEAALKAMGEFGEEAVGHVRLAVMRSLDQKVPSGAVVRAGLGAMGKIASPKDVKFLTDLLKTGKKEEEEFITETAAALAGYAKSPGQVRKEIFEEMLKMSEGVFSKSEANDQVAKRKWNTWGTDVMDAMRKLGRNNWQKPTEMRKWWNDKGPTGGKNQKSWPDEPPPDPKAPAK